MKTKKIFVVFTFVLLAVILCGCGGKNKQRIEINRIDTGKGKIVFASGPARFAVNKGLKFVEGGEANFAIYYSWLRGNSTIGVGLTATLPAIVVVRLGNEYWLADCAQYDEYSRQKPARLRLKNLHKLVTNDTLKCLPKKPAVLDPHEKGLTWRFADPTDDKKYHEKDDIPSTDIPDWDAVELTKKLEALEKNQK